MKKAIIISISIGVTLVGLLTFAVIEKPINKNL